MKLRLAIARRNKLLMQSNRLVLFKKRLVNVFWACCTSISKKNYIVFGERMWTNFCLNWFICQMAMPIGINNAFENEEEKEQREN